jgi:TatD DNase family protein
MRLFDTHAHLDDSRYDDDREQVVERLLAAGVDKCTLVGADLASSRAVVDLAQRRPGFYAAVGIHPHDAPQADEAGLDALRALAEQPVVRAWGEIGLDYHYDTHPRDRQIAAMEVQMAAAQDVGLPMIFHIRDAWGDFLPRLRGRTLRAVAHCWSGSRESAKACLDAGLYVSFSGSVTFKNAHGLREVAAYVPGDRLLLETDSPYLSPEPHRGHRNEPAHVACVADCLAAVRGMPVEALARMTYENGCRFYGVEVEA